MFLGTRPVLMAFCKETRGRSMMRKLLFALVGVAALGAMAPAPANAQIDFCIGPGCYDGPRYYDWRPYRHHYYHHYRTWGGPYWGY